MPVNWSEREGTGVEDTRMMVVTLDAEAAELPKVSQSR